MNETVRTWLCILMARHRMNDDQLALILGITRQGASNKRRGRTQITIDDLVRIAGHFDLDVNWFLRDPDKVLGPVPALALVPEHATDLLTSRIASLRWSEAHKCGYRPKSVFPVGQCSVTVQVSEEAA